MLNDNRIFRLKNDKKVLEINLGGKRVDSHCVCHVHNSLSCIVFHHHRIQTRTNICVENSRIPSSFRTKWFVHWIEKGNHPVPLHRLWLIRYRPLCKGQERSKIGSVSIWNFLLFFFVPRHSSLLPFFYFLSYWKWRNKSLKIVNYSEMNPTVVSLVDLERERKVVSSRESVLRSIYLTSRQRSLSLMAMMVDSHQGHWSCERERTNVQFFLGFPVNALEGFPYIFFFFVLPLDAMRIIYWTCVQH